MTFARFIDRLTRTGTINDWKFAPNAIDIRLGQSFGAVNRGGEVHTFTEVEEFGGGIVPLLNQLSGNEHVAPECQALVPEDFLDAGRTFHDTPDDGGNGEVSVLHPSVDARDGDDPRCLTRRSRQRDRSRQLVTIPTSLAPRSRSLGMTRVPRRAAVAPDTVSCRPQWMRVTVTGRGAARGSSHHRGEMREASDSLLLAFHCRMFLAETRTLPSTQRTARPGRAARAGAMFLSIHNLKCFSESGEEIAASDSAPPRAEAVVARIGAIAPRLRVKFPARVARPRLSLWSLRSL